MTLNTFGYGLRVPHYPAFVAAGAPRVSVVEAVTENFLDRGGRPRAVLERVLADVPVLLHGVSLSIGAVAPLNVEYLDRLRELCAWVAPPVVSDHLCFGTWGRHYGHDLWPLPYSEEAIRHVCDRVDQVQTHLGRPIALENVSSYVRFAVSTLEEWQFLSEVAIRSGCGVLLDVNNVFVNARNHGFAPERFIDEVAADRVVQFHLAGHLDQGTHLLDDHGSPVKAEVWALYQRAVRRFGPRPTIIEWDEDVPPLETLIEEVARAETAAAAALERCCEGAS